MDASNRGINPAKASDKMVAENTKKERNPNHRTGKNEGAEKVMIESSHGVGLNRSSFNPQIFHIAADGRRGKSKTSQEADE